MGARGTVTSETRRALSLLAAALLLTVNAPAQDAVKPWVTWQPATTATPHPNAFDTYLKAFALKQQIDARVLPQKPQAPAEVPPGPPRATPDSTAPTTGFLGEGPPGFTQAQQVALYADVLRLVHEALSQQCRIPQQSLTEPAWPGGFRSSERLLAMEAAYRRSQGQNMGAAASALDGLLLAQHAMSQRTVLAYLVGIACEAICLRRSLDDTLPLLTAQQCREVLGKMLSLEETRPSLPEVVAGQRDATLSYLRDLLTRPEKRQEMLTLQRQYKNTTYIDRITKLLDEMDASKWGSIQEEFRVWQDQAALAYPQRSVASLSPDTFLGAFDGRPNRLSLKHAQALVWLHRREIELAVRAHLLETGALPPDLTALVPEYFPEVPGDAFSDGAMKSVMTPTGLAIYSIGPDGVDDKGAPTPYDFAASGNEKGDLVVVVSCKP